MNNLPTIDFSLLVIAVIALVEIAKQLKLPKAYCPILALMAGIIANLGLGVSGVLWPEKVFYGALIGFSASGLFDNLLKGKDIASKVISKLPKRKKA